MNVDLTLRLGDLLNVAGMIVGVLIFGSRLALRLERRFAKLEAKFAPLEIKVGALWEWFMGQVPDVQGP